MQDKLFLCLWFWLVGISIVTGASLIYRCLSLGLSFFLLLESRLSWAQHGCDLYFMECSWYGFDIALVRGA